MLMANISPYIFIANTPVILRIMYSLAAPTFIFLCGYSAVKFSSSSSFAFWRVIFAAAFIDAFIWHLMPFSGFDVLYVISLTVLSVQLFMKVPAYVQHLCFSAVLIAWILTSIYIPYRFELEDSFNFNLKNSLTRFFIDGWFPFLPWILIGWAGAYFAKYHLVENKFTIWEGIMLFIFGLTWAYQHPMNGARNGYLEIFYPVTFPFICLSMGFIMIMLSLLKKIIVTDYLLCVIGRNSLTAYILHAALISYVISHLVLAGSWLNLLLFWSALALIVFLVCLAREKFLPKSKDLPWWLRLPTGI